ncbi:Uu.00g082650.m01.CDS01 [Anthostomella pinea]|uniref:Uu.00g082650.m01.CDS01 n=1 Tax=Anthostomella pinea TaxID=933095 RepID=A0AAI8YH48_9PEZI|nr:Uu.00g082650.m01.CDS01 [Anthostomella pinea]
MEQGGASVQDFQHKAEWKQQVWSRWMEPTVIIVILITAMYSTRRKNYSVFNGDRPESDRALLSPGSQRSSREWERSSSPAAGLEHRPKRRRVFGIWTVQTPNSSRFAGNFHSRILQKLPFLLEMFYWVIAVIVYRLVIWVTGRWFGGSQGLWDIAQSHGMSILDFESKISGMGSVTDNTRWVEWRIQQWFLAGVEAGNWRGTMLTVLNRVYALIHIPGSAAFIAYYYATSPTQRRFCIARRSMSLSNFVAFFVFTIYPCMPPRLLPHEYGFVDTVEAEDAASVWMKGDFVNALAAMPSMHFGYAFAIGSVFVYESGFLRQLHLLQTDEDDVEARELLKEKEESGDAPRSPHARIILLCVGFAYPALILLAIIATANHYLLDALAGALVVIFSFFCNRFLLNCLVLEDWLLWALRLEKPVPTTGVRQHSRKATR